MRKNRRKVMTKTQLEEFRSRVDGKCECKYDTPCNNCVFGFEEVRALLIYIDFLHKQVGAENEV